MSITIDNRIFQQEKTKKICSKINVVKSLVSFLCGKGVWLIIFHISVYINVSWLHLLMKLTIFSILYCELVFQLDIILIIRESSG